MSKEPEESSVELSPFAKRVFAWMGENKISGREMARRSGLSASYFTTLRRGSTGKSGIPEISTIDAISRVMGEDLFPYAMMSKPGDEPAIAASTKRGKEEISVARGPSTKIIPNALYASDVPLEIMAAEIYMPLDLPVLGISMGGHEGDFRFNGDEIARVRRPPGIPKTSRRAYAVYVVGESMYPAFREGALAYVNPDRQPSIGDDVIIELKSVHDDGQPGESYIKRLKKRSGRKIIVEQFNPVCDIEFDMDLIKNLHRVMPLDELLGS